jgi:NTE family protein
MWRASRRSSRPTRADALIRDSLAREQLKSADIILRPKTDVAHWADFSTSEQAIARGEEEVDRRIEELLRATGKAGRRSWWTVLSRFFR